MAVKSIVCFLLFAACAMAQTMNKVAFTPCKGNGQLMEVRVSNCASLPCLFKKGEYTTIQMDFTPSLSTNQVTTGATAQVALIKMPFRDINNTPACDYIYSRATGQKVGCNLQAGQVYTYSFPLEILQRYPTANAQVQWELNDTASKQKIVCFQLPAKIVA